MLSPKTSKILLDAGAFTDETRGLWLPILTGSRLYASYPQGFTDIQGRLAAVVATSLKAKQLNQTLLLIDRIGPVDASTTGLEGEFSTLDNREGLIEYAMAAIYGSVFWPRMGAIPSVATPIRIRW